MKYDVSIKRWLDIYLEPPEATYRPVSQYQHFLQFGNTDINRSEAAVLLLI